MKPMQIALFGTSADPPTKGHQIILQWLSKNFDLVAVWAANNPFKSHATDLVMRMAMLEILIQEIYPPANNIKILPEISSHRTIETWQKAHQKWPEAEFTLIVGSDLIEQLPHWYKSQELLTHVNLLIIPRPGYMDPQEHFTEHLNQLKQLGARIQIAALIGLDVSSSTYRSTGDRQSLTPQIMDYIAENNLYS